MRRFLLVGLALSWLGGSARADDLDWPALEREAVELTSRYLQLDTTNPPGNEALGAGFFRALFEGAGIETRVFESAPGRANVVARLAGDGSKPSVVLMHHMDVVPADARYWQREPFSGAIAEGEIWGRGALDTKASGITHAMTLLALARAGMLLGGDVVFLGVADEEAGGRMGAGFMVEQHFELFANAGVVLNEGGWIAADDAGVPRYYAVETAQKTPFWLRLTAKGRPGHGSMPLPDAAPTRLVAALARIADWETPLRVVPAVQRFYADTAHLAADPTERAQLADLRAALADPAFAEAFTANPRQNAQLRNTLSLTALAGSSKTNVIPPEASAELDGRLLPDEDPEAFLATLREVIADDTIDLETLLAFPPTSSPADHPLFDVLREISALHHEGIPVSTPLAVGFTDCHYFRERGIPCYGFAPFVVPESAVKTVHGNDERISVENVKRGTRLTFEIVKRLADAQPLDPVGANVARTDR
jgi:acetylornithine deacetylase/succinyl-diaminopimelate desuccinylase-like protein